MYVVRQVDASNGIGGTYTSTYAYGTGKADAKGRGFLGFARMSVTDVQTGIVQTTNYGTAFPTTGLVTSQTRTCPAGACAAGAVTLGQTTNTYDVLSLGNGADGVARSFVGLQQSVVTAADANGAPLPTVTTSYAYDCDSVGCGGTSPAGFGNALNIVQTTAMPDGSDSAAKTTTNTYDNDTSNGHWYLGRLRSASVRTVLGDGSSDITRQSAYTYDTGGPASTGLLASETVEPGNTTLQYGERRRGRDRLQARHPAYGYDANGNKTSAATTGLGAIVSAGVQTLAATTRTTATQYLDPASDPYARFAHQVTNALNQSETWLHSAAFGSQLQHTGPNGQTTSWSYDGFGRKIREHRPDGTETQIAYLYCAGVNGGTAACPANAAVAVTATPTKANHTTQIGPEAITYYDSLYRSSPRMCRASAGRGSAARPCTTRSAACARRAGRTSATGAPRSTGP